MISKECWKDIDGYLGIYQVSNLGNVRSVDRQLNDGRKRKGIVLRQYTDKDGYKHVILYKDSKSKHFFVHRLVAKAFVDNPASLPQVNHKDETRNNNSAENLEWCDAKYNLVYGRHLEKISEKISGESHYQHKLTNESVREIRKTYVRGDSEYGQCALARKYGVCQTVIRNVIVGKTWKRTSLEDQ